MRVSGPGRLGHPAYPLRIPTRNPLIFYGAAGGTRTPLWVFQRAKINGKSRFLAHYKPCQIPLLCAFCVSRSEKNRSRHDFSVDGFKNRGQIARVNQLHQPMKTFKIGTGHFSIWHHGSSLYASGVFGHQAEAEQCAANLNSQHGIACTITETEAGWNIKGKGAK